MSSSFLLRKQSIALFLLSFLIFLGHNPTHAAQISGSSASYITHINEPLDLRHYHLLKNGNLQCFAFDSTMQLNVFQLNPDGTPAPFYNGNATRFDIPSSARFISMQDGNTWITYDNRVMKVGPDNLPCKESAIAMPFNADTRSVDIPPGTTFGVAYYDGFLGSSCPNNPPSNKVSWLGLANTDCSVTTPTPATYQCNTIFVTNFTRSSVTVPKEFSHYILGEQSSAGKYYYTIATIFSCHGHTQIVGSRMDGLTGKQEVVFIDLSPGEAFINNPRVGKLYNFSSDTYISPKVNVVKQATDGTFIVGSTLGPKASVARLDSQGSSMHWQKIHNPIDMLDSNQRGTYTTSVRDITIAGSNVWVSFHTTFPLNTSIAWIEKLSLATGDSLFSIAFNDTTLLPLLLPLEDGTVVIARKRLDGTLEFIRRRETELRTFPNTFIPSIRTLEGTFTASQENKEAGAFPQRFTTPTTLPSQGLPPFNITRLAYSPYPANNAAQTQATHFLGLPDTNWVVSFGAATMFIAMCGLHCLWQRICPEKKKSNNNSTNTTQHLAQHQQYNKPVGLQEVQVGSISHLGTSSSTLRDQKIPTLLTDD